MLKITIQNGAGSPKLRLDGKLAGDWVHELERVWESLDGGRGRNVTLDLSGVTFVDSEGKKLLGCMLERGAKLQEPQFLVKYLLDEIKAGRTS